MCCLNDVGIHYDLNSDTINWWAKCNRCGWKTEWIEEQYPIRVVKEKQNHIMMQGENFDVYV